MIRCTAELDAFELERLGRPTDYMEDMEPDIRYARAINLLGTLARVGTTLETRGIDIPIGLGPDILDYLLEVVRDAGLVPTPRAQELALRNYVLPRSDSGTQIGVDIILAKSQPVDREYVLKWLREFARTSPRPWRSSLSAWKRRFTGVETSPGS